MEKVPYVYEYIKAFWGPSQKPMTFKCRTKLCNKEIKYTENHHISISRDTTRIITRMSMLNSWLPLVLAISSKSTAEMPLELGTYFDCIYFSLAPIFCKDRRSANKFRKMQIPKFADFIFLRTFRRCGNCGFVIRGPYIFAI